jgi:uncharacterized protein DUF4253
MSLAAKLTALSVTLPPGRAVPPDEGDGELAYWLSDEQASPGHWRELRAMHGETGLWPVLLRDTRNGKRPWTSGEVYFDGLTTADDHDPAQLLAQWWAEHTEDAAKITKPFGRQWPGLAAALPTEIDPDEQAQAVIAELEQVPGMRLGLVAAERGSDALTASRWSGPANYSNDTAKFAAVVRSWEDRFGARVICLDEFATLYLSIAAPPLDMSQALPVAAEHLAFCPDNIWQGRKDETLATYAERLIDDPVWVFWWD